MRLLKPHAKAARVVAHRIFAEMLEDRTLLSTNPSVVTSGVNAPTPAPGATNVALNADVTLNVNLPNGGILPQSVNNSTYYLYQTGYAGDNAKYVPAAVKTTGAGDALILTPYSNLAPLTSYTLVVTSGVTDTNGDTFTPYTEAFKTGNQVPAVSQSYAFSKTALPTTAGYAITDVQMGPDGDLWASDEVGQILRFPMNSDGSLGTPQVISSLQTAYGGNRLITGFAFDPSFVSNPSAPMIWVSNTYYALSGATNAPNFTSSLTVMSGTNLSTVTNVLVDLPRSVADHVNDTPVFQPGTDNLFFCEAGQNAYGAPDTTWGNRAETLLSAAILEVNTRSAELDITTPSVGALNMLTPDVGGTYDPYAANAPVTLYATGIRNAFQLYFDSTGQLWAPANGSSSGGNTPAGPNNSPPALTNVQQVEDDVLIKVTKGAYYGHPDPARDQYVLDQGNPSTGAIAGLAFTAYPVGTSPDSNYQLPNYIFGLHASPDSMFQYEGSAFGGALNGKFLVSEYSAPDDIAVLSLDSNDNVIGGLASSTTSPAPDHSVTGFTGFDDPLAIVENDSTGYVYVSELGADKLTLLKPASVTQTISASATNVAFNTIASGNTGAGPSRTETVTITNNGADPLTFSSISVVNNPADAAAASNFTIVNSASLPTSLNSLGTSTTIQIQYSATIVGLQTAILQIKSNDPTTPTLDIDLHGIGTAGQYGALEPSLVQVLRAYDIPTIVGAGPNDANINTVYYPLTPDPSSQEVPLQVLEKAGSGNVTITPLASFSASASPVSTIGYYTPGDTATDAALFSIAKADSQTIDPTAVGSTSFDPGSNTFGLYAYFPGVVTTSGAADYHYSEDDLNASLDPANPHKIRFFPDKTAAGTVIPNTYVFAVEDYNGTTYNSFVNFVGIISNVEGAPATPTNLTAKTLNSGGINLTWTASTNATSYNVESETPGATSYSVIATGLTSPSYTDTSATTAGMYSYEVQAVNAAGASAFSSPPATASIANGLAAPPTGLAVAGTTAESVSLTWNASAGATSYVVLRGDTVSGVYSPVASGITTASYTDSSVLPSQTYYYEVEATDGSGTSAAVSSVAATTQQLNATLSVTVGKGSNKSIAFTTDAGTSVLIKFSGSGTATVNFLASTISQAAAKAGVIVSGSGITIKSIVTSGSASNSVLTITTKGGSGSVNVGTMTIDGAINSITAKTTTLGGTLTLGGSANRISLGSVSDATIDVNGNIGTLAVPSVESATITAGVIRTISAVTWTSADPLTASSIGSINITGNAQMDVVAGAIHTLHVRGVLSNSTFALSGSGIVDLASVSAGAITGTQIDSVGSIGSISAGALDNSQVYAGDGAQLLTTLPATFTSDAAIGSIHVKTTRGAISTVNSNIAAMKIGSLSLGVLQVDNGGTAFGVSSADVSSLTGIDESTGKAFSYKRLTTAAQNVTLQDFTATIV